MRIAIADDSALIRDGLQQLLPAHGFEIAATSSDGDELIEAVKRTRPDVALIDIRMPPTHTTEGIAAATAIREHAPGVGVLILSQHLEPDYALKLLHDHPTATGYLLKERITQIEILIDAIQRVSRGETVVDPELVELLSRRPATRTQLDKLTQRERTVLMLMAEGLTDRAIAHRLWVTPRTIETHVRHILARLGLPADNQHNRRVLAVLTYLRDSQGWG